MAIPKTVPETVVFDDLFVWMPDIADLQRAILHAGFSPDAAFRCLEYLCAFIRARQPVPTELTDWMIRAVEKAGPMRTAALRNRVLLQHLGLAPKARPAKASVMEIGEYLRARPEAESKTQAIKAAAKKFGIAESTARKYRDLYEEAYALAVQCSSSYPDEDNHA